MIKRVLRSYRVLCAEDDAAVRSAICELLGRYFGSVDAAADGLEAWELYRRHSPDVIIADIDMPGLDGLELIERIRREDEEIPIVILSAYSDTSDLIKAAELQLVKYLLKPVDPEAFRAMLSKVGERLMKREGKILPLGGGARWITEKALLLHGETVVSLTYKERSLMRLFVAHRGYCVSYAQIMEELWGTEAEEVTLDAVKFHVSSLRKKFPKGILRNVYGEGYTLTV